MTQQTRQIGIMKSTGAQNGQISGMYFVLILGFGLAALANCHSSGNLAGKTIGAGMAQWLNFIRPHTSGIQPPSFSRPLSRCWYRCLPRHLARLQQCPNTVREAITDYGIGGNTKQKRTIRKPAGAR